MAHFKNFLYSFFKALMACLGVEPRVAGWKAQTNPLSYGGTPFICILN